MAMGIDLLPTVLDLLQLPAPSDRTLDGRSILSILTQGGPSPHDYLYYYDGETLFAVRDQHFKYRGAGGCSLQQRSGPNRYRNAQERMAF